VNFGTSWIETLSVILAIVLECISQPELRSGLMPSGKPLDSSMLMEPSWYEGKHLLDYLQQIDE
jgi:hypothetical protein